MPQSWQATFGDTGGTAEFRRKFHRPTNLEPHEQVLLVLTEVRGSGRLLLNELPLGSINSSGESVEFDISRLLNPFNEVAIELTFDPRTNPSLPGGLFGAVALEIRSEPPASSDIR